MATKSRTEIDNLIKTIIIIVIIIIKIIII